MTLLQRNEPRLHLAYDSSKLDKQSLMTDLEMNEYSPTNMEYNEENENGHKKEGNKLVNEHYKSFETLFSDIKADAREREERTRREISEREVRFEKQLGQFALDAKEREQRFEKRLEQYVLDTKEREHRLINLNTEIKSEIKNLKVDVNDKTKHIQTLAITSIVALITTVIAVVGIAVAILSKSP